MHPSQSHTGSGHRAWTLSWLAPLCAVALLLSTAEPAFGATRIRLATLAPEGSVYHKSLLVLRDEWRRISQNKVNLTVFSGGKLGGEADVVQQMGLGSVQAAMITTVGLAAIEPAVEGLQSIPMGFRDFDEVDYVGKRLQPMLEERLAAKGYIVLGWSDAGWIHFFSKQPVTVPDDLKRLKMFAWAGNTETVAVYRSRGFTAVPLETADIVPGLETGLIEVVPCPPVFALKSQIDRRAPYMIEINWAPMVGALVIRKATWDALPASLRGPMLKAAQSVASDIKQAGRSESEESVKAMIARGLQVTRPTPEVIALWRREAEAAYPLIRGRVVHGEVFDRALQLLEEFRAAKPIANP
jgi:TRAP-type transport system periplasmic protein